MPAWIAFPGFFACKRFASEGIVKVIVGEPPRCDSRQLSREEAAALPQFRRDAAHFMAVIMGGGQVICKNGLGTCLTGLLTAATWLL